MSHDYPHLLSPLAVGPKTIRNRVLVTGHIPGLEDRGRASRAFVAYHARRARGGAGLQMSGTSRFHTTGHAHGGRGLDLTLPDAHDGLSRLADAVQAEGGRFVVQLGHSAATIDNGSTGRPLLAPSEVASDIVKVMPRAMSQGDIDDVIEAYGKAAGVARRAGLDGVEILAAFGFLPGTFFSPLTNRREDAYGGSLENRLRFALEAASTARDAAGTDMIVGMRIAGAEMTEGGLDNDEMVEIARGLSGAGTLDYLNVSAGTNNDRIMRWEHWPASPAPHGLFVPLARRIRAASSIPVFVTGRVTDPALAEAIVERGDADMVGMTRAHIADPDIVRKLSDAEGDAIRPCVGANVCIHRAVSGKVIACFHNPEAADEQTFAAVQPSASPRRVAVVGGGPAGMEAARRAAELGHAVTLYEATGELGGQLSLWATSPFAREYGKSIDWLKAELTRRQVRVVLNHAVTAALLPDLDADDLIVATGSRPATSEPFPGAQSCGYPVLTPADVLTVGFQAEQYSHAIIIDEGSGRNALAAAEVLAECDMRVTVVSGDNAVGDLVDKTVMTQLNRFLLKRGVTFKPMSVVSRLLPGKLELRNVYSGATEAIPGVDLLVAWRGNHAVDDLSEPARRHVSSVQVIGDSLAPRTVHTAIAEGARAAARIGQS